MDNRNTDRTVQRIADNVSFGLQKMANTATGTYKSVEDTFVGGYEKIEDAFVEQFLRKDGETLEDAKERLHQARWERQQVRDDSIRRRKEEQSQHKADIRARHEKNGNRK